MSLINASTKIKIFINGIDYSDFLIEGNISDDSAYASNIITSRGSIVLGGDTSILDYNKTKFPAGTQVTIYSLLSNNKLAKLPRGHLYVTNSILDVNTRQTTLELGCSLAFIQDKEENYVSQITQLFTDFIPSSTLSCFIIDNYNLSTLDALLAIEGKVIFQDAYGHIQGVNQFGNDGLGSDIKSAKLTSFDLHSAIEVDTLGGSIEDLPSKIIVEASFEAPTKTSNTSSGDTPKPPPFVTSTTDRIVEYTDLFGGRNPNFIVGSGTSVDSTTEALAGCGTISEPNAGTASQYTYSAEGSVYSVTVETKERVTSGGYVSYNGPGNQVDFQYEFEHCSAVTYGKSVLDSTVSRMQEILLGEVDRAKSLLSKANQSYALRDDYLSRPRTVIYTFEGSELVATEYADESERIVNAGEYYGCAADQYYNAAVAIMESARGQVAYAAQIADSYKNNYGYASINTTENSYGKSGELTKKVVKRFVHSASLRKAQIAAANLQPAYRLSANVSLMRYNRLRGFNFNSFNYQGYDSVLAGDSLRTSHTTAFLRPDRNFNVQPSSTTTTEYIYGSTYTTEIETYEDHQDPKNNYVKKNYSSTGSKNAPEVDRIVAQTDGNGCVFLNESSGATTTIEISADFDLQISNNQAIGTVPNSWIGTPARQPRTYQLPMNFAPIKGKSCGGTVSYPNLAQTKAKYQQILNKYATNLAKKLTADNFGFRVTEHGTRAELFEYYPFYPIALNIQSLTKGYKLRAASSNWVFDSNNVLCSIDCFNVGEVTQIAGHDDSSPFLYLAFDKTEGVKVLDNSYFNLPETAASIRIKSLPAGGTVALSGVAVSVDDVITVADINAGNLVFTPSSAGTINIELSYEVLDASSNLIGSTDNIFPPVTTPYFNIPFADAGDFTANTTNGGLDADGGDFDTGTITGGNIPLNAGDFDTGATVQHLEPSNPSGASSANGDTDPETDLGTGVVDGDDNNISSDTLPTPVGPIQGNLDVVLEVSVITTNLLTLEYETVAVEGFDYGGFANPRGTDHDAGTIATANAFALNFGTFTAANEPVIASGVV